MAFTQPFGPGEGFASKLAETVKEGISKGFDGANAGTATANIELKFVADFTAMEAAYKESMGRLQGGGSSGGGSSDGILGQILEELRASRRANESVADAAKGEGGGGGTPPAGGDPDSGGSGGPSLPGSSTGLFGNRKRMQGWEMQRAMSDPKGFIQGSIMNNILAKAGRLAMGDAGEGLASMGWAASAGLAGSALAGGYALGSHITDGTLQAGEALTAVRLRDSNLSYGVGLDFRGQAFQEDRKHLINDRSFNFDYARTGLSGLNVHLQDMAEVDRRGMSVFMSGVGVRANRLGVDQGALAGFIGQAWGTGASEKSLNGTTTLLANIEEAIKKGQDIGIRGNETLQTIASLNQMEQARAGVLTTGAMDGSTSLLGSLGELNKHMFGGNKALGIMGALGNNQNPQFEAMYLSSLMNGAHLSSGAQKKWEAMGIKGNFSEIDKARAVEQSPEGKREFASYLAETLNLPMPLIQQLLGLEGRPLSETMQFVAGAKSGLPHGKGIGGLSVLPDDAEANAAYAGQKKNLAQTGADDEMIRALIEKDRIIGDTMLSASQVFWSGVQEMGDILREITTGSTRSQIHGFNHAGRFFLGYGTAPYDPSVK